MRVFMEAKILVKEKNTLELELVGMDQSLAQLLAEKLNQDKKVEFAASKMEHPLISSPKIFVRTKTGDASKLVLEKLGEIKKEVSDFSKELLDIVK
jgi:DNA-directed RNA polymerase subunit L